jgi:type IV pilus assembly protein PilO
VRGKSLTRNAPIAIAVAGVLVLGLAAWLLIVHPQSGKASSLDRQAREAQETIDAYHGHVTAARSTPKIDVADVHRLAKAMPTKPDRRDVLSELSTVARDSGIRFDSIAPQSVKAVGNYSVLPISVTFKGNFYNFTDFLYRLRSLVTVRAGRLDANGRLFSVDTLTFNESQKKFPHIHATLVIDAFLYGST